MWGAKLVLPRDLFSAREVRALARRVGGELGEDESCLYVTITSSRSGASAERRVGKFCKGMYRLSRGNA